MTMYNITLDLHLTEQQFYVGIRELDPTYAYKFYIDENGKLDTNIIIFLGKVNDPSATMPLSNDILNAYNKVIKNEKKKMRNLSKFNTNITNLCSNNGIPLDISESSAIVNNVSQTNIELLTILQSFLVCINDFNDRLTKLEDAIYKN